MRMLCISLYCELELEPAIIMEEYCSDKSDLFQEERMDEVSSCSGDSTECDSISSSESEHRQLLMQFQDYGEMAPCECCSSEQSISSHTSDVSNPSNEISTVNHSALEQTQSQFEDLHKYLTQSSINNIANAPESHTEASQSLVEKQTSNDREVCIGDEFELQSTGADYNSSEISTTKVYECPHQHEENVDISLLCAVSDENTDKDVKRNVIMTSLQPHFPCLVEQVSHDPDDIASKLYGISVIDIDAVERATMQACSKVDRANELMVMLIKKLNSRPDWFEDVCKVLSDLPVIREIQADVQRLTFRSAVNESRGTPQDETPHDETPQAETSQDKISQDVCTRKRRCSFSDILQEFLKIEKYFIADGLEGAKTVIQRKYKENPDLQLLHYACLDSVDVLPLNLVLATMTENDHGINALDQDGRTPLIIACAYLPMEKQEEHTVLVRQRMKIENLLNHGADNAFQDKDGNSALHIATLREDTDIVKLLLNEKYKKKKQCIDLSNQKGNTALHLACRSGLVDIVRVLCEHKVNAAVHTMKRKRTAIHLACSNQSVRIAQELLLYNPRTINDVDKKNQSPLHIAMRKRFPALTGELLKSRNCYPYKLDQDNRTPLHYACYWGNVELISLLLKRDHSRAFVDSQDKHGDTALHIACRFGFKPVVKELLKYKATKELQNQEGKTPYDIARELPHEKFVKKKKGMSESSSHCSLASSLSSEESKTDEIIDSKQIYGHDNLI